MLGFPRVSQSVKDKLGVAVFLMVTVLFTVWFVLGPLTISRQNSDILDGVEHQLDVQLPRLADRIEHAIEVSTVGSRALFCILDVEPEDRTPKTIERCLKVARRGGNHLPKPPQPWEPKWHSTWEPSWAPSPRGGGGVASLPGTGNPPDSGNPPKPQHPGCKHGQAKHNPHC